jgi:hypothetical protein
VCGLFSHWEFFFQDLKNCTFLDLQVMSTSGNGCFYYICSLVYEASIHQEVINLLKQDIEDSVCAM